MTSISARAPAKLILSGEHSVLYGQPALAVAVDRYTTATTSWHDLPQIHFRLLDLAYAKSFTVGALRKLKKNLQREYNDFLNGKRPIREVIKRPFELLQYSVSTVLDYINTQLPKGMEISLNSNIPIGCGMGSSAAAVSSTLHALTNFLQLNWQPADVVKLSRDIENLQHGKSSGLDLHLVNYGGCVWFKDGVAQNRPAPKIPLCIVNTGQPISSTGECVAHARSQFLAKANLAADFGQVTRALDQAYFDNDIQAIKDGIRNNHRLLQSIGVVPDKVANFIADVEANNGAAKICGAGSIKGDNAGIVLLVANQEIQRVAQQHGYTMQSIQIDTNGTQII